MYNGPFPILVAGARPPDCPICPTEMTSPAAQSGSPEPTFADFGPSFWLIYAANTLMLTAVSLLFRYADFVACNGGGELELGTIVGVGMVGALATRVLLGSWIDRHGPGAVWLVSLVLFEASMFVHLAVTRTDSPAIYLARILYMTSLAGVFGASTTYVSLASPPRRMAEMIGVLGSSGFIGLAIGPIVGDFLFDAPEITRMHVDRMFLVAAGLGVLVFVCVALATRGQPRPTPRNRPPATWILRRYQPGPILLVAVAMGIGIGLPSTFLRTFAVELSIERIRVYFVVYAIVAFTLRIVARRVPDRLGTRNTVLLGMSCLTVSMLLFLTVRSEWLLAVPALMGGVAHAFLFPAVVAGGSSRFPNRYRGLGTTLVLAMFDTGNLIGPPIVGWILVSSKSVGLPAYPAMFLIVAAAMAATVCLYAFLERARRPVSVELSPKLPSPHALGPHGEQTEHPAQTGP